MKPTKSQLAAAANKTIPDQLDTGLPVWFVGINPSLYSAAVGHHFARPGNRFWPALLDSGFTPRLLAPEEDHLLPTFGAGLTNLVARATARADELDSEELTLGGKRLLRKIARWKPQCVAFVGITSFRTAFAQPKAVMGEQPPWQASCRCWVLPNPSGLNAHYQRDDFKRLFGELRKALG